MEYICDILKLENPISKYKIEEFYESLNKRYE